MSRSLLELASGFVVRLRASQFAKPAARVVLVALGMVSLAAIGRAAVPSSAATPAAALAAGTLAASASPTQPPPTATPTATWAPPPPPPTSVPTAVASPAPSRGPATAEDPVVLNSAGIDDLRRLPGIGEKRATAIVALRTRLGKLRAIEDLMKVRGIGRATLRRLRPLVRLDEPGDAGR